MSGSNDSTRLWIASSAPPGFITALLAGLNEHTLAATGDLYREEDFVIGLDEESGSAVEGRSEGGVRAGLTGKTATGVLQISLLWVHADLRGRGIGSKLLSRALQLGRERGCIHALVDTFSFQAQAFYERHGFAVLYVLDTTLGRDVQKIFLGRKLEPVPAAR